MSGKKQAANRSRRMISRWMHVLCALTVMIAAVLVRLPGGDLQDLPEEVREAYTAEDGVPYLTDIDSYYHIQLVRNYLEQGKLGNAITEDGKDLNTLRYAPEGKIVDYPPGIVWLIAAAYRLFGGSIETAGSGLILFIAALSALAAYLIGQRLGKHAGGVTAGLLVGCGPNYALRSCLGRIDTDAFVVLMELLLILFMSGALLAKDRRNRILQAAGFLLTAVLYPVFWEPMYAILFIGLTIAGGLLAAGVIQFTDPDSRPKSIREFFCRPTVITALASGLLTAAGIVIIYGFSIFSAGFQMVSSILHINASGSGVLPNVYASIAELNRPALFPHGILQAFAGYIPGESPAAVNGVGGILAVMAGLAGLACLICACFPGRRKVLYRTSGHEGAVYGCILGVWLIAGFVLIRFGNRFLELLSIPVGLLAAALVGQLILWTEGGKDGKKEAAHISYRKILPAAMCVLVTVPAIIGSAGATGDSLPYVSDASAEAMRFIRENAQEPDAVIASWWDMGYYYETESGHPCLWDGGSTEDGIRPMLVSRALIADDPELSRRILLMLSGSGDGAVQYLAARMNTETAFEILWKALPLGEEEAVSLLRSECSLTEAEARDAERLIHPEQPRETYLIITYSMTQQIGWYEYFSSWDFTGTQPLPSSTLYSYTPSGTPLFNTENGEAYLNGIRGQEMMWQLFFAAAQTPCFTPAFEWHDGLEHVRIWRVEP